MAQRTHTWGANTEVTHTHTHTHTYIHLPQFRLKALESRCLWLRWVTLTYSLCSWDAQILGCDVTIGVGQKPLPILRAEEVNVDARTPRGIGLFWECSLPWSWRPATSRHDGVRLHTHTHTHTKGESEGMTVRLWHHVTSPMMAYVNTDVTTPQTFGISRLARWSPRENKFSRLRVKNWR